MNIFRHHPDGFIYVNNKVFTLDEFLDLETGYVLPDGMKRREYIQGVRHSLYTNEDAQTGGEFPWIYGDSLIEKYK